MWMSLQSSLFLILCVCVCVSLCLVCMCHVVVWRLNLTCVQSEWNSFFSTHLVLCLHFASSVNDFLSCLYVALGKGMSSRNVHFCTSLQ